MIILGEILLLIYQAILNARIYVRVDENWMFINFIPLWEIDYCLRLFFTLKILLMLFFYILIKISCKIWNISVKVNEKILLLLLLLFIWKFSTQVWVTVRLLKSPWIFSIFWPISTMLQFEWSLLFLLFLSSLGCKALFFDMSFLCSLVHLLKFFFHPLWEWARVSYEEDSLDINEIFAVQFGFE